jgi:hypothetical protein
VSGLDGHGGGVLDREGLLAATEQSEVATRDVPVPELGDRKVRVREMSGAIRNRIEAAFASVRTGGDSKALDKVTAQLLAACIVGENNRAILQENDARKLVTRNPRAAFRLRQAIFDVSAIDEEDMDALSEGFGADQSDGSTSD